MELFADEQAQEVQETVTEVRPLMNRPTTIDQKKNTLPVATTPDQLLAIAVEQGADMEKLEKLMALQERWEASQARKAYMVAISKFKQNPPTVIKDLVNKQYESNYSSLANMVNTVNGSLGIHGLNARWDINQSGSDITVACILSHSMGHSERVPITAGPDESGKKNSIQQIKSTITYLEGVTFQAVTGVACAEPGKDDDGNGFSSNTALFITPEQIEDLEKAMKVAGVGSDYICKKAGIVSLDMVPASRLKSIKNHLEGLTK